MPWPTERALSSGSGVLPPPQSWRLFPMDMGVVLGVLFALFSLLLSRRVLVPTHLSLEDCIVQCLCQDLLHTKCLVVTASVLDALPQGNDLLPAAVVPLQFPKWGHGRDDLGDLVLQLPVVVGQGEFLGRPLGAQEPLYGVVKRLGGSFCANTPALLSLRGSLPILRDQKRIRIYSSRAVFRVHCPGSVPSGS